MNSFLDGIYFGRHNPSTRIVRHGTKYAALVSEAADLEEKIRGAMPEDLQGAFQRYIDAAGEIGEISCAEDFKAGVRYGVEFILSALFDDSGYFDYEK